MAHARSRQEARGRRPRAAVCQRAQSNRNCQSVRCLLGGACMLRLPAFATLLARGATRHPRTRRTTRCPHSRAKQRMRATTQVATMDAHMCHAAARRPAAPPDHNPWTRATEGYVPAAARRALDGTQPRFTQVPPTSAPVKMAVFRPCTPRAWSAANIAFQGRRVWTVQRRDASAQHGGSPAGSCLSAGVESGAVATDTAANNDEVEILLHRQRGDASGAAGAEPRGSSAEAPRLVRDRRHGLRGSGAQERGAHRSEGVRSDHEGRRDGKDAGEHREVRLARLRDCSASWWGAKFSVCRLSAGRSLRKDLEIRTTFGVDDPS